MLGQLTDQELQQQLDASKAGLNIQFAPFELYSELQKRHSRPLIQDEQEDIDKVKAWQLANTEQSFI